MLLALLGLVVPSVSAAPLRPATIAPIILASRLAFGYGVWRRRRRVSHTVSNLVGRHVVNRFIDLIAFWSWSGGGQNFGWRDLPQLQLWRA
jgi:hypothetical protein